MRVLITGDRDWTDSVLMRKALSTLTHHDEIIEGEARGADAMSRDIAKASGVKVIPVPADWVTYGRAAGPIRNKWMLDMNPDEVWAFHNNIATSRGTLNMVQQALRKNTFVRYFYTPAVFNCHHLPPVWTSLAPYVYIGRRGRGFDGKWGNPVIKGVQCPNCGNKHMSNGDTLRCYEEMLLRCIDHDSGYLEPLRGKHLVCFCKPGPCHGDVIQRLVG